MLDLASSEVKTMENMGTRVHCVALDRRMEIVAKRRRRVPRKSAVFWRGVGHGA